MNLSSLSDLSFQESGEWPLPIRLLAILLLCTLLWAAGYWYIIKDKRIELAALEQKEIALKSEFVTKQGKAANLAIYKEQMVEIRQMFASMLHQLPNRDEVADLLVDISREGLINGLEFELFDPQNEQPKDFYAELPISIRVTGKYHQFGDFVSGIAALPRIVTLHNLTMNPLVTDGQMTMTITAKTYRYFDEDEVDGVQ